jgi:nucleoid DNA-binding protein
VTVDAAARAALFSPLSRSHTHMAKPTTSAKKKSISKSDILNAIVDAIGEEVSRKHVKEVIETLVAVGHKELKKSGVFVLRGFAKFVVVKKPARPAREGINPFTKEKQMFAARPASKGVLNFPQQIAVDHGAVHWTDNGSAAAPFGTDDGRVMAIPK